MRNTDGRCLARRSCHRSRCPSHRSMMMGYRGCWLDTELILVDTTPLTHTTQQSQSLTTFPSLYSWACARGIPAVDITTMT